VTLGNENPMFKTGAFPMHVEIFAVTLTYFIPVNPFETKNIAISFADSDAKNAACSYSVTLHLTAPYTKLSSPALPMLSQQNALQRKALRLNRI
jgi:hypothetical protein